MAGALGPELQPRHLLCRHQCCMARWNVGVSVRYLSRYSKVHARIAKFHLGNADSASSFVRRKKYGAMVARSCAAVPAPTLCTHTYHVKKRHLHTHRQF